MSEIEALTTLREVKAKHGRLYKSKIHLAWIDGNYGRDNLSDWDSALQRIRNIFGPSWLVRACP